MAASQSSLPSPPRFAPVVKSFRRGDASGTGSDINSSYTPVSYSTATNSFFDPWGNSSSSGEDVDPVSRKPSPFVEIGASGLAQYGGFVRDEFLPQLSGDRGLRAFREMHDNDAIVGALVFAIQMLMRKVEWHVEPPEGASVEAIVATRQKKLMDQIRAQQEQKQAEMMMQQEGLAGRASTVPVPQAPGGGGGAGNGAPDGLPIATNPAPTPSMAAPTESASTPPMHMPLKKDGSGIDLEAAAAVFEEWYGKVTKATGSQFVGGIDSEEVGLEPIDPETGEPMEFPVGTGPLAPPSPEEIHAMELAVMVETALHDMSDSWADTISQIITMIVYGFALHEICYKKRNGYNADDSTQSSLYSDGKIGWSKFAGRAQETRHRWEFDDNGNVLGMWQLAPPLYQLKYIPLSKALLFRTTGYKNNPEGRSVLRSAWRSWQFKRRIEEYEAMGVERDLAGLPVCHVPYQWMSPFAGPDEKAALAQTKQIVRNVRNDEQGGLVLPTIFDPEIKQPLFKFELLSSSSSGRKFDTDKIIARYDQRIAMVALVDFILLGHESVGAKALAETKTDLFTTALEAWLMGMADVINNQAIPRLMQINGEDPALSPRLVFGKMSRVSLTEMAQLLTSMASAGADLFPDDILQDHIRSLAGLPGKAAVGSM